MPRIRVELSADKEQGHRKTYFFLCPQCQQKLGDIEHLHGMATMRFKCRRCGTYIKAEMIGAE